MDNQQPSSLTGEGSSTISAESTIRVNRKEKIPLKEGRNIVSPLPKRKDKDKYITCQICSLKVFCTYFTIHTQEEHGLTGEQYFIKYVGEKGYCKTCNAPTKFLGVMQGYQQFDNRSCKSAYIIKENIRKNPEFQSNAAFKMHEKHPDVANTIVKTVKKLHPNHYKNLAINMCNTLNERRERLGGYKTDAEKLLATNEEFIKLKPVYEKPIRYGKGRTDSYFPDFTIDNLIIEIDGNLHDQTEVKQNDIKKEKFFKSKGFVIIRFRNEDILNDLDSVIEKIKSLIQK